MHEHKQQLHQRISERTTRLEETLVLLRADAQTAGSERARAIEAALAALQTHVSGGWSQVDEQESAALTRWLDTSQFLFDGKAVAVEAVHAVGPQLAATAAAPPREEGSPS